MAELAPKLAKAKNTIIEAVGDAANFAVVTTMIALTLPEIAIEAIKREKNMIQLHGGSALGFATLSYLGELYEKSPEEEPMSPRQKYKEEDSRRRSWSRILNSPNLRLPGDDMIG